jgi:hypothetical protein
MSSFFIALILVTAWSSLLIDSKTKYPWGFDAEKNGQLQGSIICDNGETRMKTYLGKNDSSFEDVRDTSKVMVIIVIYARNRNFYMFIPAPKPGKTAQSINYFEKIHDGSLTDVPKEEFYLRLGEAAPSLMSRITGSENNCVDNYLK